MRLKIGRNDHGAIHRKRKIGKSTLYLTVKKDTGDHDARWSIIWQSARGIHTLTFIDRRDEACEAFDDMTEESMVTLEESFDR